jgi:hypothetical protein
VSSDCLNDLDDYNCIWVEDETEGMKCQAIKDSCEAISTEHTCEEPGAAKSKLSEEGQEESIELTCIWIDKEDDGHRCQEVKDSCEKIKRGPTTCEYVGVSIGEDGSSLECKWLLGNTTSKSEAKCKKKVL